MSLADITPLQVPRIKTQPRKEPARSLSRTGPVGVAVVGCGYWGPNLIRNFSVCSDSEVIALCDRDLPTLQRAGARCPEAQLVQDFDAVLRNPKVEAIALATPVATHAPLAAAALKAGKHVLVEKPLTTCARDAEQLVALADREGLTLMVDHTFLYSAPVRKIKSLLDAGELGEIYYLDSVRINLGLFQNDINVLWDLAPHDLSIVDYLVGKKPRSITAVGACHTRGGLEDMAYLHVDFGDGLLASFHVNWLSPVKVRHLLVAGSKKSLVYNDLNPWEPVKVYDKGIEVNEDSEARRGVLISYRTGDIWSPHMEPGEPLQNVVRHFTECIRNHQKPLTDGEAGLRIVRILEAAQQSIQTQGRQVLV